MAKMARYLKKGWHYAGLSYLLMGMGLGILFTYPVVGEHPVRWGVGLLAVGFFVYLWPMSGKK
jgi:hypothetical protein